VQRLIAKNTNAKRYMEILSVLKKNGLGFLFVKSALSRNPQKEIRKADAKDSEYTVAERLRMSCEELGPTFVKLGQILSTRSDLVSDEIANELAKLQDSVTPFSFEEARGLIETQLEGKLEELFAEFDKQPVASASISQVYSARLHGGAKVAVKVQRPNIREKVDIDLNILHRLAEFVDKRTKYGKLYEFSGMVSELRRVMEQEMNFITEGENIERFRANLKKHGGRVTAPRVRWVYTTSQVLTMDFVGGIKINNIHALDRIGADKRQLAHDFTNSLMNQIMTDGFFHADPHPGNVMVVGGNTIEFIDLGMAGNISARFRRQLREMVIGIATKNTRKMAQAIMDMDVAQANVNERQFTRTLDILLDEYLYSPLGEVNIAQVFTSVFSLAATYKMKVPREFTLVAKALGTAQKIVEMLDPQSNILTIAEKTMRGGLSDTDSVGDMIDAARAAGLDMIDAANQFPAVLLNFMRKAEENDFAVEMKVRDLDKTERHFERIVNRLSMSVVLLAVCIVMAGVVVAIGFSSRAESSMMQLSVFALQAGIIIAVIIVVGILISMLRTWRSK